MRVFRVWRDDGYLSLLLQTLSALATRYVRTGTAPVGSQFLGLTSQTPALAITNEIARSAEVVAEPGCAAAGRGGGGAEGAGGEELALTPPACADASNVSAFWH